MWKLDEFNSDYNGVFIEISSWCIDCVDSDIDDDAGGDGDDTDDSNDDDGNDDGSYQGNIIWIVTFEGGNITECSYCGVWNDIEGRL